ncbi:MAG: diguanylate cyclase [Candidatus Nanopelagicales bacterium]|nr:diguanylate cyclase [Candidatus Nanopelagicales bacterium]
MDVQIPPVEPKHSLPAHNLDHVDLANVLEQMQVSEERHRLISEHANDVIWTMSLDGNITYVSPSVERLRGISVDEALTQTIDQIHPLSSAVHSIDYFTALGAAIHDGGELPEFKGELEYYRKDGTTVWTQVHVLPHLDEHGNVVEILGVSRDISESKAALIALQEAKDELLRVNAELVSATQELERLSTMDPLTEAWNRRYFEKVLEGEVARSMRYGQSLSLLMIDVDGFKNVNDHFGHHVGDLVLIELVSRLKQRIRAEDVLCRWGGEEFMILTPHSRLHGAQALAEQLRHVIGSESFKDAGTVTISVGVAEFDPERSLDNWLVRVDEAMYCAKLAGRNLVRAG